MSQPTSTGGWPLYFGAIDRKKMTQLERYAYESYNGQRGKCYNKNNAFYKNYGGRGIRVEYSAREFLGWWVFNYQFFKGRTATVGRIDHDKNYRFDNITMQCVTDNSREAALRNNLGARGLVYSKRLVQTFSDGKTRVFNSIREAARENGVSQRLIQFMVRGTYKKSKKLNSTFHYEVKK